MNILLIIGKRCCQKDLNATKSSESLADRNNECEQNKDITTFLAGSKNLFARDSNGQHRRTYLFITPRISNRAETTIFAHSSNSISRKENCCKITKQTTKDLNFHRLETGVFWPAGSDFGALRLADSRRLAKLSGNTYLNKSEIFQEKLRKIRNRTDRYLRSWPTPSQTLCYSKFIFNQIKEEGWDESEFFRPLSRGYKIYDTHWVWRHRTDTTDGTIMSRHSHIYLPPIIDVIRYNEENFRWSHFVGESEEHRANRLLRDKIVSRLLECLDNEVPLMCDSEVQLERAIEAEFSSEEAGDRMRFGRLTPHTGTLREVSVPNQLNDIEVSLEASHDTQTKFYAKRSEKQPRQTSWKGESREFFPYFWSSVFEGNCNDEAALNVNLTSGHRQVPPIQRYLNDVLIDADVDPPDCYAASLYPKDDKLASISLYARSFGLCLGRNRTAALVSRTEYCQKIPAAPQGRRSCITEDLPLCPECLR